jgi:hypothetical protein
LLLLLLLQAGGGGRTAATAHFYRSTVLPPTTTFADYTQYQYKAGHHSTDDDNTFTEIYSFSLSQFYCF